MSPVLANKTREELRQSVGDNLPDFYLGSTTSAGGDATSVIDSRSSGGADVHNGKWIRFYDGTLDGETRRVTDYDGSGDHTTQAFSATVPNAASYERWHTEFHPERIDRFINQAILDTYGRAYNPVENLSLHTGGGRTASNVASGGHIPRTGGFTRFDIPSGISAISRVYHRASVASNLLHDCDSVWDTIDADVTASIDTEQKMRGNGSLKLVVGAAAVANDVLAEDTISEIDLSAMTHIEFWVRSSTALDAGNLSFQLTTSILTSAMSLPVVSVDTWTYVRLALVTPQNMTDVTGVKIRMPIDKGAFTLWLDDIQAINDNTAIWEPVSRRGWRLEPGQSDLLLTEAARIDLSYTLLKLVGGDAPAELDADADVNEIDDLFTIYKATELAFNSRASIKDEYRDQALIWGQRATERRKSLHRLPGARKVS